MKKNGWDEKGMSARLRGWTAVLALGFSALHSTAQLGASQKQSGGVVSFDRYSLLVEGKRVFLVGGEFEYWRLPAPEMWRQIFARMRAAGLNTVSTYIQIG